MVTALRAFVGVISGIAGVACTAGGFALGEPVTIIIGIGLIITAFGCFGCSFKRRQQPTDTMPDPYDDVFGYLSWRLRRES